ncbi:hypothetical protein [Mucilaginibacter sp. CSA2-8R]|uniref:hypothetical protein n=1 Tax=Mucilaginibacter sp. CSA2-8R TaxID=3141542 RepID=UPI00315D6839
MLIIDQNNLVISIHDHFAIGRYLLCILLQSFYAVRIQEIEKGATWINVCIVIEANGLLQTTKYQFAVIKIKLASPFF